VDIVKVYKKGPENFLTINYSNIVWFCSCKTDAMATSTTAAFTTSTTTTLCVKKQLQHFWL